MIRPLHERLIMQRAFFPRSVPEGGAYSERKHRGSVEPSAPLAEAEGSEGSPSRALEEKESKAACRGGGSVQADGKKKKAAASCDSCANLVYDEDYEEYVCDVSMDEDDYGRLMTDRFFVCPYYRGGDEYAVVRHQM